jgi:hypothetical protein
MAPKTVDDDTPQYVELKLLGHVANKGYQLGSVVGVAAAGAIAAKERIAGKQATPLAMATGAAYSVLGGLGLSLLAYCGKRATIDHEGVAERVYRLHHSASQRRTDAFSAVRAFAGGGVVDGVVCGWRHLQCVFLERCL